MIQRLANLVAALLRRVMGMLAYVAFWSSAATKGLSTDPSMAAKQSDPREAIILNPEHYQFALAQMRGLLMTIRNLDHTKTQDDCRAMMQLACAQTPGSDRDHPQGFNETPLGGFRDMSKGMWQFHISGGHSMTPAVRLHQG